MVIQKKGQKYPNYMDEIEKIRQNTEAHAARMAIFLALAEEDR